jgi:hypothetical protein
MASRLVPSQLRGMLLLDDMFAWSNVDTDTSSFSEDGYQPAKPTPTVDGYQDLRALGTLETDAEYSFVVNTRKAGAAVGGDPGGRFVWRESADTVTEWRGCLEINKATGWEHVRYSASVNYSRAHAVTLNDHTVIAVYSDTTNSAMVCSVLDPSDDGWDAYTIDSTAPGPGCVVALPSSADAQRVVCIYIRGDLSEDGTNYYTLGVAYSDDQGATWTVQDSHVEGWKVSQSTDTLRQIRAVYDPTDGAITCLVETLVSSAPKLYHLVSVDLGASFTEVETIAGSTGVNEDNGFEPVLTPVGVAMFYADSNASGVIYWARKATAFSTFADDPSYDTSTSISTAQGLGLSVLYHDGAIWLFFVGAGSDANHLGCARLDPYTLSADRSRWMSSNDRIDWIANSGDSGETLIYTHAVPYKGGALLLHNPVTGGSTVNDIGMLRLGWYSSIDWRVQTWGEHQAGTPTDNGYMWYGGIDPSTTAIWTVTGAGTISAVQNGYRIATSSSQAEIARNGPSGASAGAPCLVYARLAVDSGGVLTGDQCAIRLRRADGTNDYDISVRFTSTAIRVYDNNAAAQVGSDTTGLTGGVFRDVLIGLASNRVAVYHKGPNETLWTAVASGTLTNDTSTPASTNRIEWGGVTSGTATSRWGFLGSAIDACQVAHSVQNYTNPDDLQGRAYDTLPQWLGDAQGMQIAASGGPAWVNDKWTVASVAQYAARNTDPRIAPSLDTEWRTANTTAQQTIVWSPNGGTQTRQLSPSAGIVIFGANFPLCYWEGKQVGSGSPGTWDTLLTLDSRLTIGSSLTCRVYGNLVIPHESTNPGARYIRGGELIGGYVVVTYTGPTVEVFKILDNSEGMWRDGQSSRAVEIHVEGDTSSVPGGAVSVEIIPPRVAGIVHSLEERYELYRLRIPANQDVYESYYKAGLILPGALAVFGQRYSRGRTLAYLPQTERFTLPSGVSVTRSLGRPRRRMEFSWDTGVSSYDMFVGSTPDPDYIAARDVSSHPGIALRNDTDMVASLHRRTNGVPRVVLFANIGLETAGKDTYIYSDPERFLYAMMTSPVTYQGINGEELNGEVFTVATITLEEEG